MAPSIAQSVETLTDQLPTLHLKGSTQEPQTNGVNEKQADAPESAEEEKPYKYARYLPTFDDVKYPPLTEFKHEDPGLKALEHAEPRAFLNAATTVNDLTPKFGTEVAGIQLTKLDDVGRQQLARFVAERGVVVFRDQDFLDQDPEWLINDWATFFGRPHIHPTSGHPAGLPNFHLVYRAPGSSFNYETADRFQLASWHSDVTYEKQPPGLTALYLYNSPSTGGDTGYVSQVEAYNRLSPSFRAYLETLQATHSAFEQAAFSRSGKRGGVVRREPVENVHPVVRRHPVTGQKALFVNPQFTRRIVGLKKEESDAILNLLYQHIAAGLEFQVRIRHQPRSVVLWDNRVTAHSAIVDFDGTKEFRHGARITPQAERPFL